VEWRVARAVTHYFFFRGFKEIGICGEPGLRGSWDHISPQASHR